MIFVYKKWEAFCQKLSQEGIHSIPAKDVCADTREYLVLKHDVETDVKKAFRMATIETKHGHQGTFYVQAYLLKDQSNVDLLKQMQAMGHEISYHYDVMDSCKGDLDQAIVEFETNKTLFESHGFQIETLCQHGNPVVERVGYTSNRDFFRSDRVQSLYPTLSDIMVNYKVVKQTDYRYYSDAGRKFKLIYDPIENDRIPSDDKNIPFDDLDALYIEIFEGGNSIISTHPHRWSGSSMLYVAKATAFKIIKATAKLLIKIPLFKKIMGKYYYLAKKI